jgi:hypothetical protein
VEIRSPFPIVQHIRLYGDDRWTSPPVQAVGRQAGGSSTYAVVNCMTSHTQRSRYNLWHRSKISRCRSRTCRDHPCRTGRLSARPPVRLLSRDEIEQMLAAHRIVSRDGISPGHCANFASADLSGRISGLNLRGIRMDRAVLRGADFTEPSCNGKSDRRDFAGKCFDRGIIRCSAERANLVSAASRRLSQRRHGVRPTAGALPAGACPRTRPM